MAIVVVMLWKDNKATYVTQPEVMDTNMLHYSTPTSTTIKVLFVDVYANILIKVLFVDVYANILSTK